MFQRGQKIVILESSANKKTHPRAGDVGYISNMYLFVDHKFILLDAFFFHYKSDSRGSKNRMEKKRFVVDLGMGKKLKLNLDNGVTLKFFTNKYHINLTSTGYVTTYVTTALNNIEMLVEYPLLNSNYGIWNSARKCKKNNIVNIHIPKGLYKIPYGHIALFSSKYNSKYRIEEQNDNEFISWVRSMIPVISSMLRIFCDYREGIRSSGRENTRVVHYKSSFNNSIGDCFKKAYMESSLLTTYVKYLYVNTNKKLFHVNMQYMTSGYHILNSIKKLDKIEKFAIVRDINLINSLNIVFMQRLDTYYINRFDQRQYNDIKNYIKHYLGINGLFNRVNIIKEIMPLVDIIRSIFCRALTMNCDTSMKINSIIDYLPPTWVAHANSKIADINSIKLESSNNSSALNRIYDIN